jgi:hypothetical protein
LFHLSETDGPSADTYIGRSFSLMQIKLRRRAVRGSIAIGAAIGMLCLWAGVGPTPAHAGPVTQGVPAPYVTPANSSDAHTKPCVHNGTSGFCLFTSQDLRQGLVTQGYPGNAPNYYPMSETFGYFSTDGVTWSAPTVLMRESTYQGKGWVQSISNGGDPFNPLHLWAPSAQQGGDGNWYLYVPDISDAMNPAGSSFIGVSKASDPMGPYNPIGTVDIPSNSNALNPNIPGYASDPDVVDSTAGQFGTAPYLAYADGDNSNCGGISIVQLATDMTHRAALPVHPVFDGIPSNWGQQCTDLFGRTHYYMEGPHIYHTTLGGASGNWPAGVPGPYLMVVPIKPNGVTPPQCDPSSQGQPGADHELIAYATAGSPLGDLHADGQYHWTYGGILMCGSQQEWTDQGSIMPITSHGHTALIFIYHDGPGRDSAGNHRTLHAECLLWDAADTGAGGSAGNIAQSIRTGGTQFTDSGAAANCLTSFDSTSIALRNPATGMFVSGNGLLTANRYGPGPWEKYQIKVGNKSGTFTLPATFADFGTVRTNSVSITSEANNSLVSISGSCLNANGSFQVFDFIPSYSPSGAGGAFINSELTSHGEQSDTQTAQVCDEGGAGTQWLVYHY